MRHLQEIVNALQLAGIALRQGEPLSRHTSFRIGGPVTVMAFPESAEQMQRTYEIARSYGVRPLLLGAGSNVLAPDEGLDTLLIETRTGMQALRDLGDGCIEAECGVTLARLASFAMEHGYTGLEFAHGIPGTVGGGVYMNAGAYGGEISAVLESADLLLPSGSVRSLAAGDLSLSYRHSLLMEEPLVLLSARFRLRPGDPEKIREEMAALMARRRASQPLEYPSAGSTFKRPEGAYAGTLIQQCGLKGLKIGGAQVSEKHAGFVINAGGASCRDVLAVMERVQKTVLEETGFLLEPEVRVLEA